MGDLDPRERDLVKCEDMRLHAERARQFLGSRSLDEFLGDEMAQAAVVRCIEVIGEAARLVSEDTRRRARKSPGRSSPACGTFWRMSMAPWTSRESMAW